MMEGRGAEQGGKSCSVLSGGCLAKPSRERVRTEQVRGVKRQKGCESCRQKKDTYRKQFLASRKEC